MKRSSLLALSATVLVRNQQLPQPEGPPAVKAARPAQPSAPKPRRPLPLEQLKELFTEQQRARWPRHYAPTAAPAYFMKKDGVTLKELIDAKADIRNDRRHDLQRDLAMDYQLWTRSAFEEFAAQLNDKTKVLFKHVITRVALPTYEDVVTVFALPSLALFPIEAESTLLPGVNLTPQQKIEVGKRRGQEAALRAKIARGADVTSAKLSPMMYPFTSYAHTQDFVLRPLHECRATHDSVFLPDLPAVRNVLHVHYDSSSHMRYLAHRTGEDLILTREFVFELSTYLRERWDALTPVDKKKPIMTMFGNGRLAHFLNESGLLPVPVIAQREPTVAVRRAASQTPEMRRIADLPGGVKTPKSFFEVFPTVDMPMRDALAKHGPSIVILEPHSERDYTAEARGYYTVREVLMLGRVDGNAMGSFTYPWLSFGVAPCHETYWIFNEKFQRNDLPDDNTFMPTEAPYAAQGYDKRYVDRLSRWMVGSNDTPQLPHQYRAISHRRVEIPATPAGLANKAAAAATAAPSQQQQR